MTNTISAAANPALANDLIQEALTEKPVNTEIKITAPSDTTVTLPGGFISPTGEVITEAEVRELTGKDEEAMARATTIGKAILTILQRGTVRIGQAKATEEVLDGLLSGDRDMLLLGIFKATFGPVAHIPTMCYTCNEQKIVDVEIDNDIKVKKLEDQSDRVFTVQGKNAVYTVQLPTGITQKELYLNTDKTSAELNSILLGNTVTKIGNAPVLTPNQVQNIGLVDRQKLVEEINKRVPGPQFESLTLPCPDCEGEVMVPISLGTLFRF